MIDRQWKLLEQCGVSAGGELKRVSFLLENLRKENERLSTTLTEIKEIAEKAVEKYYPDYYDEGFEEDIVTEFAQQILQKISDCEVE